MKLRKIYLISVLIVLAFIFKVETQQNSSNNDSMRGSLSAQNISDNSKDSSDLVKSLNSSSEDVKSSIDQSSTITENSDRMTTKTISMPTKTNSDDTNANISQSENFENSTITSELIISNTSTPIFNTTTSSITQETVSNIMINESDSSTKITIDRKNNISTASTPSIANYQTVSANLATEKNFAQLNNENITVSIPIISSSSLTFTSSDSTMTTTSESFSSWASTKENTMNNSSTLTPSKITLVTTIASTQKPTDQTIQEKTTKAVAITASSEVTIQSTPLNPATIVTTKINQVSSSTLPKTSTTDASITLNTNSNTMSSTLLFLPRGALGKFYVSLCGKILI